MSRKSSVEAPASPKAAGDDDPEYWTIEKFCALFGATRKAWKRHRPYLRTVQFGPRVLIPRDEVRRYRAAIERPAEKAGTAPGTTLARNDH